ncbi:glycosyltransferase [Chitinophaga qingshengii]|uniref:Glycosyltransferase family 2 protein n=1 Tax=Chitinophaga qingshengii TaxID=1569794 RepID=A0ABR7TTR3_9BACT|nr:glycosyltransferase family 2 protein [Chitinophaga qingshengii]MBC9933812.1 glycosyltransferase family 2 protein [Chitinophaga qingshengii]
MYDVVVSIVLYNSDAETVKNAIVSVLKSPLKLKVYLVDNSLHDSLRVLADIDKENIEYIHIGKNIGFGSAHNLAIRKSRNETNYNLILNGDVYFDSTVLPDIFDYMQKHVHIGQLGVKTLYPDGSLQSSCKMLPTPFDLFARRFIPKPLHGLFKKRMMRYEMQHRSLDDIMNIPNLSGCFMFMRAGVLEEVGGFDENIFMYMEDVDLTRRIHSKYDTIYYPQVAIYHEFAKGSYKSPLLLKYHIKSAIYYFNKWGWFFDKERSKINKALS